MSKPQVAFVGLGAMGMGMAVHLVQCGYNVAGFDLAPAATARFAAAGGTVAASPRDAAVDAAVFVCMVANAQQVEAALLSDGTGAAAALPHAAAILVCSTVPCGFIQDLQKKIADPAGPVRRPDLVLVDCPVSGGAARAADGTLSIMVGVEGDTLEGNALAVLSTLASPDKLYRVAGGVGAGSSAKMVHQVLAANQIVAGSEGMGLAVRLGSGLLTEATLATLMESAGRSWMLGHRGPRMLSGYQPVASATDIITKDTAIITSEARRLRLGGVAVPMTLTAEQVLYDAVARGYGRDDDASLLRVYISGREHAPPVPSHLADHGITHPINLLKGIHLAAAAECLAFAHHVALDLDLVLGLCIDAAGGSAMLETHGPHIVAALRNGTAAKGWPAATGDGNPEETLASVYNGLEAAVSAAQQIKAPVYLGAQALNILGAAMRSFGPAASTLGAGSVVKVWL